MGNKKIFKMPIYPSTPQRIPHSGSTINSIPYGSSPSRMIGTGLNNNYVSSGRPISGSRMSPGRQVMQSSN